MKLPERLIELLEDTLVSGLRLRMGDAERFKKEFREDPERFLVSLVVSTRRNASVPLPPPTNSMLWDAIGEMDLEEARKLIEVWEHEPVANH